MWRKCRSWVLLWPRFLISSIKAINCLEKLVDRVDLVEWVGSTGWRSRFYWMTESARWDKEVNSIGWCKRLRELKDITPRVPGDTFSAVATRLSRSAEPSRQVCWLQSAALLSLVTTPCSYHITPLFLNSLIIAYIAILAMSLFFYKFNFCC